VDDYMTRAEFVSRDDRIFYSLYSQLSQRFISGGDHLVVFLKGLGGDDGGAGVLK
jgi:hypothetical protein